MKLTHRFRLPVNFSLITINYKLRLIRKQQWFAIPDFFRFLSIEFE